MFTPIIPISTFSDLRLLKSRKNVSLVSISTPLTGDCSSVRWLIVPDAENLALVSRVYRREKVSVMLSESRMYLQ